MNDLRASIFSTKYISGLQKYNGKKFPYHVVCLHQKLIQGNYRVNVLEGFKSGVPTKPALDLFVY